MGIGWLKFAIQGSTYARALENAATRGGRALAPAMENKLTQMRAQPLAKAQPGLGQMFREHATGGELPMTPQRTQMRDLAHSLPWAGSDHTQGSLGLARANRVLDQRGLSSTTPGGAAGFQQQVLTNLPTAPRTRESTQVGPAPGWKGPPKQMDPGAHADHMDRVLAGLHGPSTGAAPTPMRRPHTPESTAATAVLRKVGADVFKIAGPLATAAGIGIPLAVGGSILASKPGIRADIADRLNAPGDIHQKDVAQEIPQEVQGQAARAHQALMERGINPTGLRIAVDAPSGAGKTVLSKALASQMGLRHHGLDWRPNLRFHQLMGGGDIEKTPYAPHAGEILEHQQLLRSYDPELFDVAIHIHKDPATIKQQVLKRGRGARTHDLLDYEKSIGVGRKAFETLGGDTIDLGGGVMMKVRPQEGWGNMLDQQLAQRGIDPSGLTRHQKLLSLHSGQRTDSGAGWTPYMKSPFTGGETAAIGASIPLGVMAAKALASRPL
jgi:hypothetical protein